MEKKKTITRLLPLLLVLIMVFTMMPATVMAEEEDEVSQTTPVFEIQAKSQETEITEQISSEGLTYLKGDSPDRLIVVQTDGATVTPSAYKWKKANSADGALDSAGNKNKTSKINYSLSTGDPGEAWYACEVTYSLDGGDATTTTTNRVKVSVCVTQEILNGMELYSKQPQGGTWLYGTSGNGVEDFGALLRATPVAGSMYEAGTLKWYVSTDNGESWTGTNDYGEDPFEAYGTGDNVLVLYTLPVGEYKFKATATFAAKNLQGESVTVTTDSSIADVTIVNLESQWDGEGTVESPYLLKTDLDLKTLSELSEISSFEGKYFKFEADLTLPASWTPIGTATNRFKGNIDGDNKTLTIPEGEKTLIGSPVSATLKNLNIYGTQINGNGVVDIYTTGVKGPTAITIENVTLKSGTQTLGSGFVGGYAPGDYPVVIRNCTVEEGVTIGDGTRSNIGSFGGDFNGTIVGCVSHATVKGENFVGGISGSKGQTMGDYIISDCIFDGQVIATGDNVGGISGSGYAGTSFGIASAPNTPCASITNCLVSGSVSGVGNVGGILGSEPGVKECWNNGVGYVQNNLFTGKVTATGENKGGIIGYMSCINNMNVISGNIYLDTCGADKGIGAVEVVETPETNGTFGSGWNKYTLSGKKWGRTDDPTGADADKLTKSCTAAELTDGTVLNALNTGMNSSKNWTAGPTAPTFDAFGEKHLIRITCSTLSTMNGVSQESNGSDVLAGKTLTLKYNDGTTSTVSATDESVTKQYTISSDMIGTSIPASIVYDGHQFVFNLSILSNPPILKEGIETTTTAAVQKGTTYRLDLKNIFEDPDGDALTYTVKIGDAKKYVAADTFNGVYSYSMESDNSVVLTFKANDGTKDSTKTFTVTIGINPNSQTAAEKINVSFTLLGDDAHDEGVTAHTLKSNNLETWIAKKSYDVNPDATVEDVLMTALKEKNLKWKGTDSQYNSMYISGIQIPGRNPAEYLSEFTNGPNSGWMYTVNGKHPEVGISLQRVSDGDAIIFHYTDDYTKEQGSEKWGGKAYGDTTTALPTEKVEKPSVTAKVEAAATVSNDGKATVKPAAADITKAIETVAEAAKKDATAEKEVVLTVSGDSKATSVEMTLPKASVAEINKGADKLTISSSVGEVTFDADALKTIASEATADLKISIAKDDAGTVIAKISGITEEAKKELESKITGRPVFDFKAESGSKTISEFGGKVKMNLDYAPKANEDKDALVAYWIKDNGDLQKVIKSGMTSDNKHFGIVGNHWSTYAIGYNPVTFDDTASHWAKSNITYLAARDVIKGKAESSFAPNAQITRAEFVQILANMSGDDISKYSSSKFTDVNEGAWYANAVAWAVEKGIAGGTSDSTFSPDANITRQDMSVMISKYVANIEKESLEAANTAVTFADADTIASYAKDAVAAMQKAGIISGVKNADKTYSFKPKANATRAEAATMIANYIK